MARIARYVAPGLPHHVTQRGNRRERVFFADDDYRLYRDLLREACDKADVSVWAYCLMPDHVHLILTPMTTDGLARALGKAHRRYSVFVNARLRVTGHLFQSRFGSVVMDEDHLMAAPRYVAPSSARRIGRGRACGRISRVAMTRSSKQRRSSRARPVASPIFSTTSPTPKGWPRFGQPKASGVRSAPRPSSTAWRR